MVDSPLILQLNSMYGPACEEDVQISDLQPNIPKRGAVDFGEFCYCKFSLQGKKCLISIYIKGLTGGSECDLYVSSSEPYVTKGNYMWKSTDSNSCLQIHPIDSLYNSGEYYVGIYGVGTAQNLFELVLSLTEPIPIHEVKTSETCVLEGNSCVQFVYKPVKDPGYILQVSATPGPSQILLYGAWNYILPTKLHCQISSSSFPEFQLKEYDPFVMDANNKLVYLDDYTMSTMEKAKEGVSFKLNSFGRDVSAPLYICVENLSFSCFPVSVNVTDWKLAEILPPAVHEKYLRFVDVFKGIEGGTISHEERAQKELASPEYTYGEIDFIHFFPLLNHFRGRVFWDLGCGTGKSLITAAMCNCGFEKIRGIEFLHGLCKCGNKAISRYVAAQANISEKGLFEIIEGDITKVDWSDGDIIFASSLCFPEKLMETISEMGANLKKGTIIMSIKKFMGPQYKLLDVLNVKMGWGKKPLYIMERI